MTKTFRSDDQALVCAYENWMLARRAGEMEWFCRNRPELAAWSEGRPLEEEYRKHLTLCREALQRATRDDPWVNMLREAVHDPERHFHGWSASRILVGERRTAS